MEEVEEPEHSLKAGKSPEVDNIPYELLNNGGKATTILAVICQRIWGNKMAGGANTIAHHTYTKGRQPQAM